MARSTKSKSSEQEQFVAKYLNGRVTLQSGAGIKQKGDVRVLGALLECKTYMEERESFTVKREWLTKIEKERFEDRVEFAFLVQNFGGKGDKDNYVIMSLSDFRKIYHEYLKEVYYND